MVRYTHFESDEAAAFVADGHRVMYLGSGDCTGTAAPAQTACECSAEWVVLAAEWCGVVCCFTLRQLCRLVIRLFVLVMGALLLPLAHELACVGGALVMYPLGAVGRHLASAVEQGGLALSERSVTLSAGRRVLDALGQVARGRSKAAPLMAATKSTALAVRGCDHAEVER